MEEIVDECVTSEDLHSHDDIDEEIEDTHESDSDSAEEAFQSAPRGEDVPEAAVRNPRPQTALTRSDAKTGSGVPSKPPPRQWTVSDVTSWLERTGFGQYRRKFIHHSIDGAVLLQLTETQLKIDIGIGPLGHRFALLKAIDDLNHSAPRSLYQRPQSAPARGRPTQAGARLQSKIERLEAKTAERRQWVEDVMCQLREDETRLQNLKSELRRLENRSQTVNHTLDQKGKVPWFPTGRVQRPLSPCSLTGSLEIRGVSGKSFLERLSDDLESRRHKARMVEKAFLERGRVPITEESLKRDTDLVIASLSEMEGTEIEEGALMEYLDDQLDMDQLQSHFSLDTVQSERIEKTKGSCKIVAIAGAIRTQRFMESYRMELQNRDSNLKTLKKKWFRETHKRLDSDELLQKELAGFHGYISEMGWDSETIQDDVLDTLIHRAMLLKGATENQQSIDWAHLKDGLSHQLEGETALESTIQLLARVPLGDLQSFLDLQGDRKRASLYRALRSQRFLEFVGKDMDRRRMKIQQYWESCAASKKVLSKEQVENFFERLIEDGIKRQEKRQQQIQEKRQKEERAIKEMANRKFSKPSRRRGRS